jgi:single-strand DNA-binding protein
MPLNVCVFTGNLTKDIELQYSKDGKAFSRFSIAVNDGFGANEHCSFFDMTAFGKTAETLYEHCKKGDRIGITGRAQQDSWEKDGQKRTAIKFICDRVEFLMGRKAEAAAEPEPAATGSDPIPF